MTEIFQAYAESPSDRVNQRRFYREAVRIIRTVVIARGGSSTDADDITSTVALAPMSRILTGEVVNPAAYVAKIAANAYQRLLRRRQHEPPEDIELSGQPAIRGISQLMLAELSEPLRDAFVRYYLLGESVEQIVEKTGVSDAAIRKRIERARKAFIAQLGNL